MKQQVRACAYECESVCVKVCESACVLCVCVCACVHACVGWGNRTECENTFCRDAIQ